MCFGVPGERSVGEEKGMKGGDEGRGRREGEEGEVSCLHNITVRHIRVFARPFLKGTVPFGSAPKPAMCSLAPPQNQYIFNSHLNYLDLKTVEVQTTELSEH